jgi:transcription elongation factor SPT6
MLKWVIFTFS